MKLTIEEVADMVNEQVSENLTKNSIKDGRQSSVLSTRRIRDYITKGLIEKPGGDGREKWFNETHVSALVALRLLQHNGLSEQYIMSATQDSNIKEKEEVLNNKSDELLKNDALSFLNSLNSNSMRKDENKNSVFPFKSNLVASASSYQTTPKETDASLIRSLVGSQTKVRQFNEYVVNEGLGVYLKVDSSLDDSYQKQLVEVLKKETINFKGDKK